jgi:hypothetical protein
MAFLRTLVIIGGIALFYAALVGLVARATKMGQDLREEQERRLEQVAR